MIVLRDAIMVQFGRFQNKTLSLQKGVQVIYGSNEAGKSTVQLFMKVMLYGVSGSKKDDRGVKERGRMIPWNQKFAQGILRFEKEDRLFEIHRRFGKTAAGDKTEILDSVTGETVDEFDPKNLGLTLFGVPETVFEKTFWLRQGGAFMGGADRELSLRLLNLMETGDEEISADAVLQDLDRQIREIKAKDKRNNLGILDKLWTMQQEKIQERYQLASQTQQREAEEARREQAKQQIAMAEERIVVLQNLIQQKKRLDTLKVLDQKWSEAQRMQALAKAAKENEIYQRFQSLGQDVLLAAEKLEKNLETLDQTDGIGYDKRQIEQEYVACRRNEKRWMLILGTGFLLWAAALLFALVRCTGWVMGAGVCGVAGLVASMVGFINMRKAGEALRNVEERQRIRNAELEQKQKQQDELAERLEAILGSYGCENCQELRQGYLAAMQLRSEWEGYDRTYRVLLEGEDVTQLKEAQQEYRALLAGTPELEECQPEQELQKYREIQVAATAAWKDAESKLSYVYHSERTPADVETELRQITLDIQEQEKRLKALEMASRVFSVVYQKRKTDFTPKVNQRVNEWMKKLTHGAYGDVRVSEEYRMQVATSDGSLWPAEQLSTGTYDQIYLALRLALSQLIGKGDEPLFLDDFLVTYDDKRAASALELLQAIAENRQVLVFTCHGRDRRNAERLGIKITHLEEVIE